MDPILFITKKKKKALLNISLTWSQRKWYLKINDSYKVNEKKKKLG